VKTDTGFLNKNRLIGDSEADQLIEGLFTKNQEALVYRAFRLSEEDILKEKDANSVHAFLSQSRKTPAWFNEVKLVRGQKVFAHYAAEIMTLLGAMALPYCYAASPGNKALYLSDKMRQSPGKRLLDTANFIINVSTPGTLSPEQVGHVHINKTRLIHAIARYYVKKSKWDMAWGEPINQEDMAGTNLAFSLVILHGLQKSGYALTDKQKEDFIYLWRYIGYQLHIDEDLLPTSFKEAYQLALIIKKRNFKKSPEGEVLTKELLAYYHSAVPANQAYLINAQVRHFLGAEIAGYLGLKPEPLKDTLTDFMSSFMELKNLLSINPDSFQMMIANHQLIKMNLNRQGSFSKK
jgi:hypothetical protein